MKKKLSMKKLVLWLTAICVCSFIIGGIVFFITGGSISTLLHGNFIEITIDEEKTFNIDNLNKIYIETLSTDINLIPTDNDEIKVALFGKSKANSEKFLPQIDLIAENEGNKLNIKVNHTNNTSFGFFTYIESNTTLKIYIPKKYVNDINIKTNFGDLNINDLNINDFSYNSDSGNVVLESFTSKHSTIESSYGEIKAIKFSGDLDVRSTSGDVSIEYLNFNNNVDIESSYGDIKLKLPQDSQFNLKAKTSYGDILSDFSITVNGSIIDKSLEGSIGESNNNVSINATSGDIKLYN